MILKFSFFLFLLSLLAFTGCVSTSDLEELGSSLQGNQENFELKLTSRQDKDRQATQSGFANLEIRIESGLKQQETQLVNKIDEMEKVQQQNFNDLMKEIQRGDQNLETILKEKLKIELVYLQTRLKNSLLHQKNIQKELDAMALEVSVLKMDYDKEMIKINSKLKEINEAINISRSIQDVQVSFGSIKNRIDDSKNRVESQEIILRQLDGQIQKTERSNLLLEKDIRELEGRMIELRAILEQRQLKKTLQSGGTVPVQELEGQAWV